MTTARRPGRAWYCVSTATGATSSAEPAFKQAQHLGVDAAPLLLGGGLDPGVKFLREPHREIHHGTIVDAKWM